MVQRRVVLYRVLMLLLFGVILLRLAQLQILQGRRNREYAEQNRIRVVPRAAPRGSICDRHGRVLATSRLAFAVRVVPEELSVAGADDPVEGLAELLGMPVDDVRAALARAPGRHAEVVLDPHADPAVVARLEENAPYVSGVTVTAQATRRYPYGSLAAHVLGYVREVSPEELAQAEMADRRAGELTGKEGVEKVQEVGLRGAAGGEQVEVDATGRLIRTLGTEPPLAGQEVRLTLDLDLQRAAERALGSRMGAVIALDPHTGEVLALVSHPAFDPNLFTKPLPPKAWRELNGPARPQQNRATTGRYAPGSVFKIVTAAAALEAGKCSQASTFYCSGSISIGHWRMRCWKHGGHGAIDYVHGFAQSCNVMFATLGRRAGPEGLADMARRFGLGQPTGVDLPEEDGGLIPTEAWKRDRRNQPWYPGDTCQMSIGQGDTLVTPLQVAREFAVVASGGYLITPHLVLPSDEAGRRRYEPRSVGLKPETLAALRVGMEAVIAKGGTAHAIASPDYQIAGKTGTAQAPRGADHAWFAGYAPADDPRLVVAVLVEHGGHGGAAAAPIARTVFDAALLPRPEGKPQ
jgi:penicillin-binding protein 2